jgi:cell division protein FtsW (lipid II flippase)
MDMGQRVKQIANTISRRINSFTSRSEHDDELSGLPEGADRVEREPHGRSHIHPLFLASTLVIFAFGAAMAYTLQGHEDVSLSRYILYVLFGLGAMFGIMKFGRKMPDYSVHCILGMLLLTVICVFAGKTMGGARRDIEVFGLSINVADLSALAILPISCLFYRHEDEEPGWNALYRTAMFLLPLVVLLMLMPSLTAGVMLIFCTLAMILETIRLKHPDEGLAKYSIIFALVTAFCLCLAFFPAGAPLRFSSHYMEVFITRGRSDPYGSGWQLAMADKWLRASQFWGPAQGVADNTSVVSSLPLAYDGFILVTVIARFGWAAGCALLLSIVGFLLMSFDRARKIKNDYGHIMAFSACVTLLLRFAASVLMNFNLFPVAGFSIPFVSYNPTAYVTNLVLLGVILSGWRHEGVCLKEND